jgi:hypothetical protein
MSTPIKNSLQSQALFNSLEPNTIISALDLEVTAFAKEIGQYNNRLSLFLQNRDEGSTPVACVALQSRITLRGSQLEAKIRAEKGYVQDQSEVSPNPTQNTWLARTASNTAQVLAQLVATRGALPPQDLATKFDNLAAIVCASRLSYNTLATQAAVALQKRHPNLHRAVLEHLTVDHGDWVDDENAPSVPKGKTLSFSPLDGEPPRTARNAPPIPRLTIPTGATAPPSSAIQRTREGPPPSLFELPATVLREDRAPQSQQFPPSSEKRSSTRRSKSI